MRPVPHNDYLPVPSTTLVSDNMHQDREIYNNLGEHDDEFQGSASDGMPQLFSQPELNDLLRDLNLPKDVAEGSKLKTCFHLGLIFHGTDMVNRVLLLTFPKMD
jgi:hypothetical protein